MEDTFYESYGVKITNARCIFPDQTYILGSITSVRLEETPAPTSGAFLAASMGGALAAFGLLFALNGRIEGFAAVIIGAVLLWGGVRDYQKAMPWYHVLLTTSSGERRALSSKDPAAVREVADAINQAVVYRARSF